MGTSNAIKLRVLKKIKCGSSAREPSAEENLALA